MMSALHIEFQKRVQALLKQHKGERIVSFDYDNQRYWLKQPEKLKGVWRLLKPQPQKAFQNELKTLQFLAEKNAPVPQLMAFGEDFLVLKDAGKTISYWVDKPDLSSDEKLAILADGAKALTDLHKKGLFHGRPALRDMAWNEGKVQFIDFESRSNHAKLNWQKVRDSLIFIHSLGRSDCISDEQMRLTVEKYQQYCEPEIWQQTQSFIAKNRWLYYLLLPFKPIARMDLIAIYRLFENTPNK
ncbi:phosphotransferase [Avibacterium paragallinarum]|uniref:phosphotransferase n=1 Tax=Avibacterium paragallinarum TaxID=728 RepID=UPI003AF7467A